MMTLSRRSLLAAGTAAGLAGTSAHAQATYPSQPIRLVVPYAPGGGSDFTGRLVAQKLQEMGGYNLIVDNRAGAAGMLGTEIVARAPADGYTLLYADVAHGINPAVYSKARYDPVKSFVPVTLVGASPQVLVAPSVVPGELAEGTARDAARADAEDPGWHAGAGQRSASHLRIAPHQGRPGSRPRALQGRRAGAHRPRSTARSRW